MGLDAADPPSAIQRAKGRSRSPTSWRLALYDADRRLLRPRWRRGARRPRLRHQPRGRPAVRRVVARGARRCVAATRRARSVRRRGGRRRARPARRRRAAGRARVRAGAALRARRALAPRCGPSSASCSPSSRPTRRSGPFAPGSTIRTSATRPCPGSGPIVTRARRAPAVAVGRRGRSRTSCSTTCPFDVVERAADGWSEVRVGAADDGAVRRGRPCPRRRRSRRSRPTWPPVGVPVGARLPVPPRLRDWLARCARVLRRGEVAARRLHRHDVDELVARGADGWLRTYRAHERGSDPARRTRHAGHHLRRAARVPARAARRARALRSRPTSRQARVAARARASTSSSPKGGARVARARARRRPRGARRPQPRRRGRRAHRPRRPRRPPGPRPARRGG